MAAMFLLRYHSLPPASGDYEPLVPGHRWHTATAAAIRSNLALVTQAGVGTPPQKLRVRVDTGRSGFWLAGHEVNSSLGFVEERSFSLTVQRAVPSSEVEPYPSRQTLEKEEHLLRDSRRYLDARLVGNSVTDVLFFGDGISERIRFFVARQSFGAAPGELCGSTAPHSRQHLGGFDSEKSLPLLADGEACRWEGALGLPPRNTSWPAKAVAIVPQGDPIGAGHYALIIGSFAAVVDSLPDHSERCPSLPHTRCHASARWRWAPLDALGRVRGSLRGHYVGRGVLPAMNLSVDTTTSFLLVPPEQMLQVLEDFLPQTLWYLCQRESASHLVFCECDATRRLASPLHLRLQSRPAPVELLLTPEELLEELPQEPTIEGRCLLKVAASTEKGTIVVGEALLKRYAILWDLEGRHLGIAPAPGSDWQRQQ
eukprot:gnl/TRDRNA2_/TRDRNA2_131177_c0_seq2.p1 gnl/TRDRNA2_/TRDRNA2_131177_c0~~gnl/TRDRNA2_/TRDRNA2_131177_c0_seq2.p1  ORF type:complete len:427 (+),score=56.87 gnl/TRDRNA2_/TRDRNA2_131177_c0_seq2:323-1603(+)